MHKAYRGEPCLGGDRARPGPANPGAIGRDGHLPHKADQISVRVRYAELRTLGTRRRRTTVLGAFLRGRSAHRGYLVPGDRDHPLGARPV
jgi:hypothetical protein